MALMAEEKLSAQAQQECEEAMQALLDAELYVVAGDSELQWDPVIKRHVFAQKLTVMRMYDEVDITISPEGDVQSFRDQNRFEGATYREMDDGTILNIARTTGMISEWAWVDEHFEDDGGMLSAVVEQRSFGLPQKLRITINPTLEQVAALQVMDEPSEQQEAEQ